MVGRRPKPTALKVLQGNPGHRALKKCEPKPRRGMPTCPSGLNEEARKIFLAMGQKLDSMGVLTAANGWALELLADALAEYRSARLVVRSRGRTYSSKTEHGTIHRVRPEVRIASDAWQRARSMLIEFGLTPAALSRVDGSMPDDEEGDDRFFG